MMPTAKARAGGLLALMVVLAGCGAGAAINNTVSSIFSSDREEGASATATAGGAADAVGANAARTGEDEEAGAEQDAGADDATPFARALADRQADAEPSAADRQATADTAIEGRAPTVSDQSDDQPAPEPEDRLPASVQEASDGGDPRRRDLAELAALAPKPVGSVNGRRDWAGELSAAALDLHLVARDQRSWGILWQLVGRSPPGTLPADTMAVAVFLGTRPTGGFQVMIDAVEEGGDAVTVEFTETMPDGLATQIITAPYAVRLVALSPKTVRFDGRRITR